MVGQADVVREAVEVGEERKDGGDEYRTPLSLGSGIVRRRGAEWRYKIVGDASAARRVVA